ncbi:MAG: DNA gyrase/topoisomerase IV subunit A [Bacteroidales bacterium]|nr:DNA gyrase/topoisomerase IV subunit A [Bacteroidales bacterium]
MSEESENMNQFDEYEYLDEGNPDGNADGDRPRITLLSGMYKDWFLDYASYVILERAVPHIDDGLKPVQRRILHSMKRLEDGRYNKVANIIGHTMQFHPHGDASIGDALVQLGQKELLIDQQGNWGNVHTGDGSAAPRYIEARLSKFALDVVFNPKTTQWKPSYDGRNKEPIALPVKFPLLLAQGVEGIAVGLASKILPHNFLELIDASINILQGKEFELFPDFPTAGLVDVSRYNDGIRGGAVKVRAKIDKLDKKTLVITELPFGRTTGTLIESIIRANEKGKIKIRKIDDNTAENVEILVHLAPGVSSDKTIDALYAFTDCELSISPNCCVIEHDKPRFIGVSEILKHNTNHTLELLKLELQIRMSELEEDWHFSSLEKIFIEKRIYRDIEECETWEAIITAIDDGLKPYKKLFRREITEEDITKLTEIRIKRISKFDAFKADEHIKGIETEMEEVQNHLDNIVDFTINYFIQIRKKHGAAKERRTEIRNFDTIVASKVVVANEKLYVDRKEGFFGMGLKKEEFVCECSDIDDIIVFLKNGKFIVSKVSDKSFFGKDILHIDVFKKNDDRTIYNVIYRDGKAGNVFMKRFPVTSITRDKEYDITKGTEGSRILYFSANPNGEAEVVKVWLKPKPKLRRLILEQDFSELVIKGRSSIGNILTKNEVHKISLKEQGVSTLGGLQIWFDWDVLRLNNDERGEYLGEFHGDEKLLVITKSGKFRMSSFELTNHYEDDLLKIEKFNPNKIFTVLFFDGEQEFQYLKRFQFENTEKLSSFIGDNEKSYLIDLIEDKYPILEVQFGGKHKDRTPEKIDADEFIAVKSFKARGKRLSTFEVKNIVWLDPKEVEEEEVKDLEGLETSETELATMDENSVEIISEDNDYELDDEENEEVVEEEKSKAEDEIEEKLETTSKMEFIDKDVEFIIEDKKDKPEKPAKEKKELKQTPKKETKNHKPGDISQMSLFDD